MKGRKRKKPVTLAGAMGRITEIVTVADPYDAKPLQVLRATNHSPLDYLLARGRLDAPGDKPDSGQARHIAGTRMQGIYERAGGRGAGAIDYAAVRVDTSMVFVGTPDRQAEALSELAAIRREIGAEDYAMLHAICCEQIPFMRWVDGQFPSAGRKTRVEAYSRLRGALDGLIGYFGVAIGKLSTTRAYRAHVVPEQDLTPAS